MLLELTIFSAICITFALSFVALVTLLSYHLEKIENRKKRNVIKILETSIINKNANRKN